MKIDELRPEYDLSKLKRGIRGKYYARARAGTNLVLIEPRPGKCLPGFKHGEPSIAIVGRHSKGGRRSHKAYASGVFTLD